MKISKINVNLKGAIDNVSEIMKRTRVWFTSSPLKRMQSDKAISIFQLAKVLHRTTTTKTNKKTKPNKRTEEKITNK